MGYDMTHTPGPWHVDPDDLEADIHSAFGMIARTMGHPHNQDDEGRANALLIAAAPDMLAQLRDLQSVVGAASSQLCTGEFISPEELNALADQLAEYAMLAWKAIHKAETGA
jgi:hypothetical protein